MTAVKDTTTGVYKGVHVHPQGGHPSVETPSKTIKSTTSRTCREEYTARGGVHVHPCTPLADWLDTLRRRGITAAIDNSEVTLHGPATNNDLAWLHRHHDALAAGATGTHPAWWNAVVSRWLDHLELDQAPDGCAVHHCPGELHAYSPEAIPFCADHHPNWWYAHLEEATGAA